MAEPEAPNTPPVPDHVLEDFESRGGSEEDEILNEEDKGKGSPDASKAGGKGMDGGGMLGAGFDATHLRQSILLPFFKLSAT